MSSPEQNRESGAAPEAPRTLENGFAKSLPGVGEWITPDLNLDALPDPVKAGSPGEDVLTAWSNAMIAHQQLTEGAYAYVGLGGVSSYQNDVDIAAGDAPGQLLVRARRRKEPSGRISDAFHAIDVSEDGTIDVQLRVAPPASFQTDELGDANDQPTPTSFASSAQKDAIQAFRKLHLMRHRRNATIELLAVNGDPHLMVNQWRPSRSGDTESCYAWNMHQLRSIHGMEDVRSQHARDVMTQNINMSACLQITNAPADGRIVRYPLQRNAEGAAHRRVLDSIEANTLQTQLARSSQSMDLEADRELAGDLFRSAIKAAGGGKLPGRMGAYVLDSAETGMPLRHLISERPDILVTVRERHEKDEGVIWDIRPYVIAPNGDISRMTTYSSEPRRYGGDFDENHEGLRQLCAEAARHAGHADPPAATTERQEQAGKALRSLLDVAERQRFSAQERIDMQRHDPRVYGPVGRPFLVLDAIRPCLLEMAHVKGLGLNGDAELGTEVKSHALRADGGSVDVHENEGAEYINHAQFPDRQPADIALHAVGIGSAAASRRHCAALLREMGHVERDLDADAEGPAP